MCAPWLPSSLQNDERACGGSWARRARRARVPRFDLPSIFSCRTNCRRPSATRRAFRPTPPPPTLCLVSFIMLVPALLCAPAGLRGIGGEGGAPQRAGSTRLPGPVAAWLCCTELGSCSQCLPSISMPAHPARALSRSGHALLPLRVAGVAAPAQRGGAAGAAQPRVSHQARAGATAGHEAVSAAGVRRLGAGWRAAAAVWGAAGVCWMQPGAGIMAGISGLCLCTRRPWRLGQPGSFLLPSPVVCAASGRPRAATLGWCTPRR